MGTGRTSRKRELSEQRLTSSQALLGGEGAERKGHRQRSREKRKKRGLGREQTKIEKTGEKSSCL